MEKLTLSVVRLVLIAFVLTFVAVGCDGDDEAAPADISGVWQGPWTFAGESGTMTGTMTFTIQQEGSSVTGTWQAVEAGGEGGGGGTFSGTYANGVATITLDDEGGGFTATVSFSGNTASGTATMEDGEFTFTLQKVS